MERSVIRGGWADAAPAFRSAPSALQGLPGTVPAAHSPCHFRIFRVKARHVRGPRTPGGLLWTSPWAALRPINFCKNKDLDYGDDRQGIEGDRTSEERQGGRPG